MRPTYLLAPYSFAPVEQHHHGDEDGEGDEQIVDRIRPQTTCERDAQTHGDGPRACAMEWNQRETSHAENERVTQPPFGQA